MSSTVLSSNKVRVVRAFTTETLKSDSTRGRVQLKTIKISIYSLPALNSAIIKDHDMKRPLYVVHS